MYDEVAMRVFDRGAHREQKPDAVRHWKLLCVAELVDGTSVHVLHHQVRVAVRADSAVQKPCDIRMIELGQDLALGAEPFREKLRAQVGAHHFQRRLLLELAVGAMGQVNRTHAARADLAVNPVFAESAALRSGEGGWRFDLPRLVKR